MAKKQNNKFTVLTTGEAEVIVQELGKALDSHREWSGIFRTMLVCRTKPDAAVLNPHSFEKSNFAKWYYQNDNKHLQKHPGFTVVGKNSEALHKLSLKLAQTVDNGENIDPELYQSFVESVNQFRTSIRTLLSEAWDCLRYTDPLTGVMTRTAMQARLEAEQERSRREEKSCCLGLMDIDHFKKVNDTHGHQAGDDVLRTIAEYVNTHLRHYDQVFRYGGEEFLLLLPNSTPNQAKKVLDRLRQGIKRQSVDIGNNQKITISASFGVSVLMTETPAKESIEFADRALYQAKHAGRNKVIIWKDPVPV